MPTIITSSQMTFPFQYSSEVSSKTPRLILPAMVIIITALISQVQHLQRLKCLSYQQHLSLLQHKYSSEASSKTPASILPATLILSTSVRHLQGHTFSDEEREREREKK
jgi:hypothetical protein